MFTNKAQERVLYFCCDTYYGQMYQIFFCVGRLILFFLKKIKIKRSPASWQPRRPLHLTNHNSHSCTLEHQTHRQMQQWNLGSNFCWCHQRAKKLQEHQKVSLSSSSSIVSLQKGLQEHKEKKKNCTKNKLQSKFVLCTFFAARRARREMSMNADLGKRRELTGLQQRRALYQPELPPCLEVCKLSFILTTCKLHQATFFHH